MKRDATNTKKRDRWMRQVGTVLLCAFFVSGICGLVHEMAWTRLLRHVMGNTTYSITTVLCAFMGGLALGSYVGGRLIDRRNDALRVFAILEVTIGLYCLLLPWLIDAAEPIYRYFYHHTAEWPYVLNLVRFLFSAALLLMPATFMGATLPVLARFFVRSPDEVGWSVGTLYAVNTFGAVVGAASAGFVLLPELGLQRTIYFACLLNFAVAAVAYVLHRRIGDVPQASPLAKTQTAPREVGRGKRRTPAAEPVGRGGISYGRWALVVLLVGYGLSGFAALVYEIAWTRVLTLMIGSSVYAFSLILTAFILGLALGSMVFARFVDSIRDGIRGMAVIQVAIAVSALLVVPFLGGLPFFVTGMISRVGSSFWLLSLSEFLMVLLVMLAPTILMGAAFPLATRVYVENTPAVGRSVGVVYASNTIGSVLGAFVGGLVLIPALGLQWTIFAAVLVNVLVACALLIASQSLVPARKALAVACVVLFVGLGIAWLPAWDASRMSFGPYIKARRLKKEKAQSTTALEEELAKSQVIFHKEGIATTVTVKEYDGNERILFVNGKPDASSTGDLSTQQLLAHVPLLLHPEPRSALVIGLASGITLGSAGRHPLQTLDCVEISPVVVEACRLFEDFNYHVLDDPRTRIILADGRNHLALSEQQYDVIISEPSNPWIAGVGDLFTREFFELCQKRLTPQGLACIWIEGYNIDLDSFRSIVHTFHSVFPNMTLWGCSPGDFLLVGAKAAPEVDYQVLQRRLRQQAIAADLAKIDVRSLPDFFSHLVMTRRGVAAFAEGADLHTDDNARLEFAAPRILALNIGEDDLYEAVEDHREFDLPLLTGSPADRANVDRVKEQSIRSMRAKSHTVRARLLRRQRRSDEMVAELAKAAAFNRFDPWFQQNFKQGLREAHADFSDGRIAQARRTYEMLLQIDPDSPDVLNNLAWLLLRHPDTAARNVPQAIQLAEKACLLTDRKQATPLYTLSLAYAGAGRYADALATARLALAIAQQSADHRLAEEVAKQIERLKTKQPAGTPAAR